MKKLRVEVAEGDGNTNPKVAKTSNENHNFQSWLRYENQAMFVIFVAWVKRTTLTRHLSSREHQDATMEA